MFKFDNTLMTLVQHDLNVGLIPMLMGEPGIGKSSWLEALAGLMRTKCFTVACNQLADKADLTGARLVPVTDGNGATVSYKQVFYPHADIHDAIEYATEHPSETPLLFLDEINRTPADVTSAALSIPTARKIGSIRLPDNLRVVIAGNDKGNITTLDSASISRFTLYPVCPDTQTFLNLDPELNVFVRNVLTAHPDCIFCKPEITVTSDNDDDDAAANVDLDTILSDEKMEQFTTPRTISGLSRWLNTFTNQELTSMLASAHLENGVQVNDLQQAIEGHVGSTRFTTFLLQEIVNGCSQNVNNQGNVLAPVKPAAYDQIKSASDITTMRDIIANMSENDRSACIVYALYEPQDNSVIIRNLTAFVNQITADDTRTMMQLSMADRLDHSNVEVLLNTHSPLANTLQVILTI